MKSAEIPPDPKPSLISVVTVMDFAAPAEVVWESLMFYEQIEKRAPRLLRLLLPVLLRTEGRPRQVGDQVQCLYRNGSLIKRVTAAVRIVFRRKFLPAALPYVTIECEMGRSSFSLARLYRR